MEWEIVNKLHPFLKILNKKKKIEIDTPYHVEFDFIYQSVDKRYYWRKKKAFAVAGLSLKKGHNDKSKD